MISDLTNFSVQIGKNTFKEPVIISGNSSSIRRRRRNNSKRRRGERGGGRRVGGESYSFLDKIQNTCR